MSHIWLRHEYKSNERRAPITPEQIGLLVKLGHKVSVESSASRVFRDNEYQSYGAEITAPGSWHTAPDDAFILGIKEELQETISADNHALRHRHIYFAHVFKGQKSTPETMRRFTVGKGTLLDLEYLVDESGKRIAAFSYSAGFAGATAAAYIWAEKRLGKKPPYALPDFYLSRAEFIHEILAKFGEIGEVPTALVIGASGRSGHGASDLFSALGINAAKWGRNETQAGGPFREILDYDIMCNCVFLARPVAPFLTAEFVAAQVDAKLSVIADVSNDLSFNPIFGISRSTKFNDATIRVGNVDVIEIENLPALTPLDSSKEYANQLFPYLLELFRGDIQKHSLWERAALTYFAHQDIPQLAIELGRELAEIHSSDLDVLTSQDIQYYVSKIFAKNVLSRTDQLYFEDHILSGAAEVLSEAARSHFARVLKAANLGELYHSPRMNRHHALLEAVNGYSRSLEFAVVKVANAQDAFFDLCDHCADLIDHQPGAEQAFEEAKAALLKQLGANAGDPAFQRFLAGLNSQ